MIFAVYSGLIAPIGLQMNLQMNAQIVRGKTRDIKQTNMNLATENGLQFRLSEGVEGAETREVQPQINADPLSESETSNLLKRIPAIKEQTDDKTDFAKRAGSLPPPKTGKIVNVKFPSDERTRNAENQCRANFGSYPIFARRRSFARARFERNFFAADGCRHFAGTSARKRSGAINTAARRQMALARNENFDVRHDKAFSDGDEIYRANSCRNKID